MRRDPESSRLGTLQSRLESGDILPKAALVVWVIIIVVVSIRLPKYAGNPASIPHLLYEAGTHWLHHQPLYQEEGTYRYSPGVAAILSLFARMPLPVAAFFWLGMSLAAFFAGFLYWLNTALPTPFNRHQRALLVLLATPLILGNFNNLQANPVCLGAMFGIVAATLRKQWLLAAVCIAVATSLKVYPLAIGLVLLVLFPRRLWLALLLGLALAGLVPFLFANPDYVVHCYKDWATSILSDERSGRDLSTSYRDLSLLWRQYLGHFNLFAWQLLQLAGALSIALAAGALRFSKRSDAAKSHFLLGLVLCWTMLLGPSTESATYMMLGPYAAWLLLETLIAPGTPTARILAFLAYAVLLVTVAVATTPFGRRFITWGPQPIAAMIFLIALLALFAMKPKPQ